MELLKFLGTGYTPYHVVNNCINFLEEQGFTELSITDKWKLQPNGKYFVTKNGSALIAFTTDGAKDTVFNICACHTDSPCLKIKGDRPALCSYTRANCEMYGGALLYSMLDIPLRIAGRVFVATEKGVECRVVTSSYNTVIPSLAIHHNPDANKSFSVNVQKEMLPLIATGQKDIMATLCDGEVLDADLYVVPDVKPFIAGSDSEFLCSPRIDNLTSVYSSVKAIAQCKVKGTAVVALFDNEEIGSGTKQGAKSEFLPSVLRKIIEASGGKEQQLLYAQQNGMILSVDNGHATHPSYAEKYDSSYKTVLNGGVVIKHHVNYSTDGQTSALLKYLLKGKVPYQDYYNRSDMRCGSTLGLFASCALQMKSCDIGIAQLAMHSAVETAGLKDVRYMTDCLTEFFGAEIGKED